MLVSQTLMTQQNRDPLFGDIVSTPWGSIAIMNNSRHIVKVQFVSRSESDKFDLYPNDLSNKIVLQLCEYFDARRKTFSLPIKLTGSAFQVAVWQQLSKISWGTTCSYGGNGQSNRTSQGRSSSWFGKSL